METILKERPYPAREERMSIGIIGAGALGSNLSRAFAKAGISAVILNSRGPQSLAKLFEELGPTIRAGTTLGGAKAGVGFLALPWGGFEKGVGGVAPRDGRLVV